MAITDNIVFISLVALVGLLISLLGYFAHIWVAQIDSSISSNTKEIENIKLTNHRDHLEVKTELTKLSVATSSAITLVKAQTSVINKEGERLEKVNDNVIDISKKFVVLENKVENLGKVILLDGKRDRT